MIASISCGLRCLSRLVVTVFCRINAPAWINTPLTFEFTWPYLRNYWTGLNQIFSTHVEVFEFTPWISSRLDKGKGSTSASAPGVYLVKYGVWNIEGMKLLWSTAILFNKLYIFFSSLYPSWLHSWCWKLTRFWVTDHNACVIRLLGD